MWRRDVGIAKLVEPAGETGKGSFLYQPRESFRVDARGAQLDATHGATLLEKLDSPMSLQYHVKNGHVTKCRSLRFLFRHFVTGSSDKEAKGWLISSSPDVAAGDTTPWFACLWEFCTSYCTTRFGQDWHLSPEQSLLLHAENTAIPPQLIVYTPKMLPGREPGLTLTPHQPGRHHSSGQEPSPEQHGPYIGLDALGENPPPCSTRAPTAQRGRDRVRPASRHRGPRRSPHPVSRTGVSRRAPDSVVSAVMEAGRRWISHRDAFMRCREFPPGPKSSAESP